MKIKNFFAIALLLFCTSCLTFLTACNTNRDTFTLYTYKSWDNAAAGTGYSNTNSNYYLETEHGTSHTLYQYFVATAEPDFYKVENGQLTKYSTITSEDGIIEVYCDINNDQFVDKTVEKVWDGKTMWLVLNFEILPLIKNASYLIYQVI